jgi:chemotaxis protein methyltransferase WspC
MAVTGIDDPDTYADRLVKDPSEWQSFVEDTVVVESWFFRGGDLFAFLAKRIAAGSVPAPFRVLSVPCCTGEEPYSLAMALREENVPASKWSILGVDLSVREIAAARHGCYSEFSFRQIPPKFKTRYFKAEAGVWRIDEDLRSAVSFRQGNLVDALFLNGEAPFDLILCRNVMIYLTPTARIQALANLERLLSPDGWLCMGSAEALNDARFEQIEPREHFLYRRKPTAAKPDSSVADNRLVECVEALRNPPSATRSDVKRAERVKPVERVEQVGSAKPPPTLQDARRLADRGDTEAALDICRCLENSPAVTADVYYLLGVLHLVQGSRDEAGNCFRKALYLDPDNREALMHLMHHHRERGDGKQADLYRLRLERLGAGGDA